MIEVREAGPSEHAEAGRVTADAYREFVRGDDPSDWWEYLDRIADVGARADRTTILVAVEDGRILGSLTLELEGRVREDHEHEPLAPDEAHVRMLGVDPGARRRGIARLLMADVESRALGAGKTRITLHTTQRMRAAQALYEGLGFDRAEDEVFPDGFVLLGYEKQLV
jgi:ribosomal protein S18 acetylase RimI-like enzyme